ncbi:MAG: threonine/serine dehydratase [Marinobacter sp.]|uniref:threonine/serine dehydratase n=1 Tax=Marinobacter sp. TaxID=50741 RepID=UPI0032995E89
MTKPTLPDQPGIREAEQRIRPHLGETPLLHVPDLDAAMGQRLGLKCESFQRTGSFKARGALNWLLTASDDELKAGLVTVSAGNHAIALAWAAAMQDVPLTVVMPEGSSPLKIRRTRALGAEVIVQGTIQQAVALCHEMRDEKGLTLVHPYNDVRIMAGQGTVGLELLRQQPAMDRVLCPIGGGGLISGLGLAIKTQRPEVELIGVEPEGAATMFNARQKQDAGASLDSVSTWAASLAPAVVGDCTYAASRQVVDRIVTVSEAGIREATRRLLTEARLYVEPGASVGLAALLENQVPPEPEKNTVLIITGGNLDPEQVSPCL